MYYWEIWWGIAALIWIFTILHSFVISKLRYKRKRILTPNKLCIAGTFLSAAVLFCPIYVEEFAGYEPLAKWAKSILISIFSSAVVMLLSARDSASLCLSLVIMMFECKAGLVLDNSYNLFFRISIPTLFFALIYMVLSF